MAELLTGAGLKGDVDPLVAITRLLVDNEARRQVPENAKRIVRALLQGPSATQSERLPVPGLGPR